MNLPDPRLFTVADAFEVPGRGVVIAGVNPDLESPRELESLVGRAVVLHTVDGRALRSEVLGARVVASLSGAFNLFLLVEAIDHAEALRGARLVCCAGDGL